jgi:uncharacterized protein
MSHDMTKSKSNKEAIIQQLSSFFKEEKNVVFAYLFGSFVTHDRFRDIDIGIYYMHEAGLLESGLLKTELEQLVSYPVDIIQINKLTESNPELAFDMITAGRLLISKDPSLHQAYKEKVLVVYYDTAFLRNQVNETFRKRLDTNKFGYRNYVE